jgi:hypothetical protein
MAKQIHTKMLPEVEVLFKRFKSLGYDKISEFTRDVKSDLAQESWGFYFNGRKGEFGSPDVRSLLIMAHELSLKPEAIKSLLLARGENKIADLVVAGELTSEEKKIIEGIRGLAGDAKKLKLVKDLLAGLRG